MTLVKIVTFVVLKILDNLIGQVIANVRKILKTIKRNVTFILNVISESSIYFA